jgi:16S rRNA (cytidine1402-2'-O)-methyltransferase
MLSFCRVKKLAAISSAALPAVLLAVFLFTATRLRDAAAGRTMRSMNDMKPTLGNKTAALYVVATPIGNLGDITLRALEVLRRVDAIACEDTRHARRLLDHYNITASTFALHDHNEHEASAKLVAMLQEGKSIALITDAGTPGISDPGARAVAAAQSAGFQAIPLPGPSAVISALSASGLSDERFLFVGFLPVKSAARRSEIEKLMSAESALVFYEAPHRIEETISDLAAALEPERQIVIARELTKMFEQIARMPVADAPAWLQADENRKRGEFVLIVSAAPRREGLDADIERVLKILAQELPTKQAAKLAAEITGHSKNELYERALLLKNGSL